MSSISVVAPLQKRPWVAIAVTVAVALLVTVVAALVVQPGRRLLSRGGSAVEEKAPELAQAPWRFDTGPAGATGKLTNQQTAALERQRGPIRSTLKSIYNGLFIDPAELRPILEKNFTGAAARSFRRSGAGIAAAGTVETTYRGAEIAMQPLDGVRRAVATVSVRAVEVGGKRGPMLHRATLWMERPKDVWKVVAFEVAQKPIVDPPNNESKKRANEKPKDRANKQSGDRSKKASQKR